MHHAVILARDPGDGLRPLTNEATPLAFLALGEKRTLLQRSVDRLSLCLPPENLWVLVKEEHMKRAREDLAEPIRISAGSLQSLLPTIRLQDPAASAVLLEPVAHVVADEDLYCQRATEGLAKAAAEGRRVVFVSYLENDHAHPTGIQAWPVGVLAERLSTEGEGGGETIDLQALPGDASQGEALPGLVNLNDAGWISVSDWVGIRRLLAYVEKPWGYERLWAINRYYAGKILFIRAGESLSLQYHRIKDETIRVLSGRMRFTSGRSAEGLESLVLDPGMSFAIPVGLVHQMEAIEDCTVVEVSTPQLMDVVRLEDRYGRT